MNEKEEIFVILPVSPQSSRRPTLSALARFLLPRLLFPKLLPTLGLRKHLFASMIVVSFSPLVRGDENL
jgi:hypothetical protein